MPTATSLTLHQDLSNRLPFECLVSHWEMNDHRVAGHALKHAALSTATADNNLDDITSSQYANATAQRNLRLKAGRLYTRIREPYFFSYVRERLAHHYGPEAVRSGGLKVYTTIVPRYQRAAVHAIRDTLYLGDDPASAVVAINPANGAIEAMSGVQGLASTFQKTAR